MKQVEIPELKCTSFTKVILSPDAGVSIGRVMVEAARMSLALEVNVEFVFSGNLYQILFNDLLAQVQQVKPNSPKE